MLKQGIQKTAIKRCIEKLCGQENVSVYENGLVHLTFKNESQGCTGIINCRLWLGGIILNVTVWVSGEEDFEIDAVTERVCNKINSTLDELLSTAKEMQGYKIQ